MMSEFATRDTGTAVKPSLLLPSGATLSVVAALLEAIGDGNVASQSLALVGAAAAFGAWALVTRSGGRGSSFLGVRFFSILAMALAISGLFISVGGGWLGMIGVIGLWLAAGGAGLEWWRGRTYVSGEG